MKRTAGIDGARASLPATSFLSTWPAGPGERRFALAVVLVSLAFFVAAAPFAKSVAAQPAVQPLALVVEDHEQAAALIQAQLETTGFAVRHAVSAEAALALVGECTPDLITLDILLPGMDGWGFLHQRDYVVLRALGGREGIELARRCRPDLITLDLEMPDVNGFQVVEALKSSQSTAHIPIVVVTGRDLTRTDREQLNGRILEIVDKADVNHGSFIGEVQRAMSKVA